MTGKPIQLDDAALATVVGGATPLPIPVPPVRSAGGKTDQNGKA